MSHSRAVTTQTTARTSIGRLYEPALAESVRYDRTTYGFSSAGLLNAAAGVAGLVRNGGRIQLICDQTLEADVVQAVIDGKVQARRRPTGQDTPGVPDRRQSRGHQRQGTARANHLDGQERPAGDQSRHQALRHLPPEDRHTGPTPRNNRIAFNGSANESIHGWDFNYEYLDVFCSWKEPMRVDDKEEQFHQLWEGRSRGAIVIPIPDDYQKYLKQVAPPTDPTKPKPPPVSPEDERDLLWSRIRDAIANDPATTAETVAAELWPHQENFRRQRATGRAPDRLLIADEVGTGQDDSGRNIAQDPHEPRQIEPASDPDPQERPPAVATGTPAQVQYRLSPSSNGPAADGPHPPRRLRGTGAPTHHGTLPTA